LESFLHRHLTQHFTLVHNQDFRGLNGLINSKTFSDMRKVKE
jgi:hypothetical protein